MKGKPWTVKEESSLKQLVVSGERLDVIAAKLGKSKQAIRRKAERLGLEGVGQRRSKRTTTSDLQLPKELPSVEEALKILAGALISAAKPGLDRVEVQRLQVVATLARTYTDLLADYVDYWGIEAKVLELEAKYARLAKKKS